MGLAATGILCLYIKEATAKLKNEASPSYTVQERNRHRRLIVIVLGFLFFSPTSVVVFQTFVCETFEDGTQALVADSSVICYTPLHITYIVYASFMVLIYPIGLPVFYTFHLHRCRDSINPKDSLVIRDEDKHLVQSGDESVQVKKMKLRDSYPKIQTLRFIYGSYQPKHMYFEVVDCVRRLFLTALPILFLRSTVFQIVIVLLISLLFTAIFMELKPYALKSDNNVAILCQWVISLTLIGSLCLRVDMTDDMSFGPEAIGIYLTIMVTGILVYSAYVSIVPIIPEDEDSVKAKLYSEGGGVDDSDSSFTANRRTSGTIRFTVSDADMTENPMTRSSSFTRGSSVKENDTMSEKCEVEMSGMQE
mmetsp:Transcript_13524/g.22246  ORF Transcript_13524/g.22246 Transcript_13524/m.22246 type:complete len:364 (+) Transcript_13524:290-1381(+)